ncbi:diaminopimelate epimerase [Sessilibacter sp. MAH4]
MRIRFTKMHGLGNDFVMIDAISQRPNLTAENVRKLCDRRFGIGCDQLLVVDHPTTPDIDFKYRIFNSDGSEVQNCGNGARCFAKFVRERKLTGKSRISVETCAGVMILEVNKDETVRVNMGEPILAPHKIPFAAPEQLTSYPIIVDDQQYEIGSVSMGNPHAVLFINDTETAPVQTLGAKIECHPDFPEKVNVSFAQVMSRTEVKYRVFERGVGETLACGTGACAAVACGIVQGKLDNNVTVHLRGGDLKIQWQGVGHPLYMTGPAVTVYHGQVRI